MIIRELIKQTLTIAGKKYEYPDTEAIVSKINELVRAINELQDRADSQDKVIDDCAADISRLESKQTPKTPKAELIEDYGYDLAEAVEECNDLFKKGPIEPVTITDIFNEMQQVRADLWNKIEWLGEKLDETKGGDNE